MRATKKLLALLFVSALSPLALSATKARAEASLCAEVASKLSEGDILLSEIRNDLFQRVARISGGWAGHTAVAFHDTQGNWVVAESLPPLSKVSTLCSFVGTDRSRHLAVRRLNRSLSPSDIANLKAAAKARFGIPYDYNFDYDSEDTFCSKFVHEVFEEALNLRVGRIQTLGEIMKNYEGSPHYDEDIAFWQKHYGGEIPKNQRTLTPHSIYIDSQLETVFETP